MKIDDLTRNLNQISRLESSINKKLEDKDDPLSVPVEKNQSGEKVEFSEASVDYSKASEAMEKIPYERSQRLEKLQRMVKEGTYHVDAEMIADSILKDFF
jgi:flagellar biosynthesis anti-sigma factor FlgM